mmetsp:Transcript_1433/g.4958  ORF Transcript_1433/g.4958 Transcript_1433/m.4958 type:complete len:443 (+) Transcript_1433:479-1807(+)
MHSFIPTPPGAAPPPARERHPRAAVRLALVTRWPPCHCTSRQRTTPTARAARSGGLGLVGGARQTVAGVQVLHLQLVQVAEAAVPPQPPPVQDARRRARAHADHRRQRAHGRRQCRAVAVAVAVVLAAGRGVELQLQLQLEEDGHLAVLVEVVVRHDVQPVVALAVLGVGQAFHVVDGPAVALPQLQQHVRVQHRALLHAVVQGVEEVGVDVHAAQAHGGAELRVVVPLQHQHQVRLRHRRHVRRLELRPVVGRRVVVVQRDGRAGHAAPEGVVGGVVGERHEPGGQELLRAARGEALAHHEEVARRRRARVRLRVRRRRHHLHRLHAVVAGAGLQHVGEVELGGQRAGHDGARRVEAVAQHAVVALEGHQHALLLRRPCAAIAIAIGRGDEGRQARGQALAVAALLDAREQLAVHAQLGPALAALHALQHLRRRRRRRRRH